MPGIIAAVKNKLQQFGKNLMSDKEKADILKELEDSHNHARKNQSAIREKYSLVEAFLDGLQIQDKNGVYRDHVWASAQSDTGDVDDEWLIINEMLRIHLTNVQRLSTYDFNPEVIPNDKRNVKDKNGARIGKLVLRDHIRRIGENEVKLRVAGIMAKYCLVFSKTYFNPMAGRLLPIEEEYLEPTTNADGTPGEPIKKTRWSTTQFKPEGAVEWRFVSPRNILLPKWTKNFKDVDWVEEFNIYSVEKVYRDYGVMVKPEQISADDAALLENQETAEGETGAILDDKVILKEKITMPCSKFPQGAIHTWVTGQMIQSRPLMPAYDGNPYDMAILIPDDKTVWVTPWLWHLIPMQKANNLTITSMERHIKMSSKGGRLAIPKNAGINLEQLNNGTANHVEYSGDKAPTELDTPELQSTFFNFSALVESKLQSIGAVHDIARNNKQISGNAIAQLQEIDDTILKPALQSIEQMYQRMCEKTLKLEAKFARTSRIVKAAGKESWMIEEFRGDMLAGNFDCSIKLLTGLPGGKFPRLELLTKLFGLQIVDREEIREKMEFGADDELMEEMGKNAEIADRIVEKVVAGKPVVPHVWDPHPQIIKKLIAAMRENYDEWEPEVQKVAEFMLQFSQKAIAITATPAPVGQGPVPGTITGDMTAGPGGEQVPAGPAMAGMTDSGQNASQQPPRSEIQEPMVTGMQNISTEGG